MKKILILGLSPLPTENDDCTLAPGKRTWQFTQALLEDGHRVCLVSSRHPAAYQGRQLPPIQAESHGNFVYYSLAQDVFESRSWLQKITDRFEPDCIVGATVFPSYIATRIATDKPIWIDLFGHIMAEAQTKSYVFDDDYYLRKMWQMEQAVLDRGDIFSTVSTPQAFATIGELGTRDRLNRNTTGYSFLRVIPCSIIDVLKPEKGARRYLRGKYVSEKDFVILWSGGYNTWTDVNTLFQALEIVFDEYPDMKFVSTGGPIQGHDELTYQQFLNLIRKSRFRERFIMRGWIPFEEVPYHIEEADVGINIDLYSYEAILGSRNRILDWMQLRLPIITSELCELSRIIGKEKLGYTFLPENTDSLVNCLRSVYENRDKLEETAARAHAYAFSNFTIQQTTKELREWVRNPQRAPDCNRARAFRPSTGKEPRHLTPHYWASIRNQIRYNGLVGTVKWLVSRPRWPFSRKNSD